MSSDATAFFLHYNDYKKEMAELVEALGHCYDRLISVLVESPAKAILWDSNVDSMITYPDYFRKDILPWWRKASDALHAAGKLMIVHPDGENNRLMDLLADCGADICEAVAPFPMTKVTLAEYYDRWCRTGNVTLWGGIPESMLLEKSTSRDEFEAFLDQLFSVIAPGKRFIAGIGDTTPPGADFDRLVRMGERFEKEGRLPIEAGAARFVSKESLASPGERQSAAPAAAARGESLSEEAHAEKADPEISRIISMIREDVFKGEHIKIVDDVKQAIDKGLKPQQVLNDGMLAAMEVIGSRFTNGSVFIPEVLLSARAMNAALSVLEPHLSSDRKRGEARILIGTVRGDLHDIGKNMVSTMLKGVGFDVIDLGINVSVEEFVKQVAAHQPDILGMSALLTTTMPQMKSVIDALAAAGLRGGVKIMVGGAPVNAKFASEIDADGYARDAGEAVELARKLGRP